MKFRLSTLMLICLAFIVGAAWIADRHQLVLQQQRLRLENDRVTCELLLHHTKKSVRLSSITRLLEINSLRSVESLIYALSDPDPELRYLAREVLSQITDQSFSSLPEEDILPEEIENWKNWAFQNGLLVKGDKIEQRLDELVFRAKMRESKRKGTQRTQLIN